MSERFWSRVQTQDKDDPLACWIWDGALTDLGYGRVWMNGRERLAHRVAWELIYGEIPPARRIKHLCDEPACVRPDHLELGPRIRLPGELLKKIRESPLHHAALARKIGAHRTTVSLIRRSLRRTYT
jgi:hypothetical protein